MLIANFKLSLQPGHLCTYNASPATWVHIQEILQPVWKVKMRWKPSFPRNLNKTLKTLLCLSKEFIRKYYILHICLKSIVSVDSTPSSYCNVSCTMEQPLCFWSYIFWVEHLGSTYRGHLKEDNGKTVITRGKNNPNFWNVKITSS